MKQHAQFIVEMTATPKNQKNLIEMTNEDMCGDVFYLLKTKIQKTKLIDDITNEEIIDDAIQTFKQSKKEYQKLTNTVINPAMLIQVMNEADYQKDPIKNEQFQAGLNLLESKLQKAGLKYLKYLNNAPEVVGTKVPNTLDYAAQLDAEIDAIIFKIGPAIGWDIPRANMLLQIRNVSSETLNLQTLGRIMRNPYPNLEKNDTTDKYYVWSNYQKPTRSQTFYQLKDNFLDETFIAGFINQNSKLIKNDDLAYKQEVITFINSNDFINRIKDIDPEADIIYDTMTYGLAVVKNKIPNHIYLKIDNLKKTQNYEKDLKISYFFNELTDISNNFNTNLEIVKYVFFAFVDKLQAIKTKNTKWFPEAEPYELKENAKTLEYYQLWKDNYNPKQVKTSDFKNYGYYQISDDQDIQYLDSKPELQFFKKFNSVISSDQHSKIKFFAKMPTLGSQVYFEYYSKLQKRIAKTFMDFAIKYKGKTIMVEVKSKEQDYNQEKTDELLEAYKIYMKKFNHKKISLVLYQYDDKNDSCCLHGYINNQWQENISFRDLFDELLK